ncbi:MAG: class I SAM-dependent methyltransferase [Myxococcota bacterium]
MSILGLLPEPTLRSAYHARQASIRYPLLFAHGVVRRLLDRNLTPSKASAEALQREYRSLLERDLDNATRDVYPRELLFEFPLRGYAWALPRLLAEVPRVAMRLRRGGWQELPDDVDTSRFPNYFRRTFHWQSDGYLSRRSARLYDLSVEVMFMGCADVMRRQMIPPIAAMASEHNAEPLRILDVGCGTGRTLLQIARAVPGQQYYGVDLSPYYVEEAREVLSGVPQVSLLAQDAEKLPFRDGHFDVVTSCFLFHELPRAHRARVIAEAFRVLRPGGLFVCEDSAQHAEASDLSEFLEAFASDMHEPFYRDYVQDDLARLAEKEGFEVRAVDRAWLAKVVTARRPAH